MLEQVFWGLVGLFLAALLLWWLVPFVWAGFSLSWAETVLALFLARLARLTIAGTGTAQTQ